MSNFSQSLPRRTLRIAVLMTCFNRRESTINCLQNLFESTSNGNLDLQVYLVDDGSTDDTAAAVTAMFKSVKVEISNDNLFWCRGMSRAFEIAKVDDPDYYFWLNDDSILSEGAVDQLIATAENIGKDQSGECIVVGSTVDPVSGVLTYGGCNRHKGIRKMRFHRIAPANTPQRCDTMNGNIVLISKKAAARVGNLDPVFEHAMGDTDYGLRANKLGVPVWVAPGFHGTCSNNSIAGTYLDTRLPLVRRWKHMMHRKGLPWRSWLALTSRHAGPAWPLYFLWPYLSLILGFYKRQPKAK
jgi:GT2 family glycosyltransferase